MLTKLQSILWPSPLKWTTDLLLVARKILLSLDSYRGRHEVISLLNKCFMIFKDSWEIPKTHIATRTWRSSSSEARPGPLSRQAPFSLSFAEIVSYYTSSAFLLGDPVKWRGGCLEPGQIWEFHHLLSDHLDWQERLLPEGIYVICACIQIKSRLD